MIAYILLGAVAVGALVTTWSTWIGRRRMVAAVDALATRLNPDGTGDVDATGDVALALSRIERKVQRTSEIAARALSMTGLLERALDRLPEGVVITDASGTEVIANAAARMMAGSHHGDAIVLDAVESLGAAARDGHARERTLELVGPPRRTVIIRAMPFEATESEEHGALVVVEDVTERRRLEDVRTDFVANVSHELKTPVGGLALLAETMADEDDPEVVRRLADKMLQEAHRVGSIITDLLELSRIETGELPVRGSVLVRRVVNEAVERVRSMADARDIRIERLDPPARFSIAGDRRQLVSAVGNLLENAVKYSDDGSVIELVTDIGSESLDIVVRDHGIGIPARDLHRVFERFYRVDRARSRETGGTGLGLAIVRHVAENHGGMVQVESIEGQGSTFTLRLPLADVVTEMAEAG
jgi:two-component system sensor histidine kinase SenX3